jgi:hypothetical protein
MLRGKSTVSESGKITKSALKRANGKGKSSSKGSSDD